MRTVWLIDDEEDILTMYKDLLELTDTAGDFRYLLTFDDPNFKPQPGDLVYHDYIGVGTKPDIDDVEFFCCSGSDEYGSDVIQYYKPLDIDKMVQDIKEKLS